MSKSFVLFLLIAITANAWSHRHHHHHHHHEYYPEHRKENSHINFVEQKSNFENEETADTAQSESLKNNEKYSEVLDSKGIPFSPRRLEKMLEKALLKIITGDLGAAEMLLLKSLNYTPEEVLAIRERELDKRRDEELRKIEESNGKKYYDENLYRDKAKHWNYNSMELEPSSRNDPDVDVSRNENKRNRYKGKTSYDKDFDFDAYNRQAVIDYENLASKLELQQQSWSEPASFDYEDESRSSEEQNPSQNIHQNFDRVMEPHVIFKIPYDDSEFDSNSGSDEKSKFIDEDALVLSKGMKHRIPLTLRHTTARNVANSFHASSLSTSSSSSASSAATGHTPLPIVYQLRNFKGVRPDYPKNQPSFSTTEFPESIITSTIITNVTSNATSSVTDDSVSSANDKLSVEDTDNMTSRKISEYEGLEWVGDDVYRVIPAFADSLGYDNTDENGTSDYEEQNLGSSQEGNETDTLEYQNDTLDPVKLFIANANISIENVSQTNLTANQQLSRTNREENVTSSSQSQKKAIEDIKSRILAITGRFNLSTNTNQVQRERLAMFSPVCHIPRNTDSEAWMDPFLMNMHFQLNLTSDDYVVAARLRLHVFPQKNVTTSDYRLSNPFDEEEDDEKKIRVSVYYYTKSLKKHRSKKRLMDSVVTPLNAEGAHLALDVRQGLRFWRPSPRNPHGNGNNHGLVVQIEDQDGRPLKPALYIQQSSCVDHDFDEKTNAYLHFSSEPAIVMFAS
ncbi:PREDICTED: uncharacterized protein LOC105148698 isoform X1 [Acromyrmex echinatior]|uniref:uncharacterized protein LOC105148698 isoform X1 n=1 Tax=Acromyrmex echinatior TaxID=103372 RepID=UPI000580C49E|nr:PREDICTED: uncharacterized protein LOC105148698 isoform X1 [Acromyrmex echinatior]